MFMSEEQKKRKKVHWSDATNLVEKKPKFSNTKKELSEEAKNLAGRIDSHINNPVNELLIAKLNRLKYIHKELYEFMQYTNYHLFTRALETRNLVIISYLLEKLDPAQCLNMLLFNEYASIKNFIQINKNLEWNIDLETKVVTILQAILNKSNWQVKEIIQNSLADSAYPSNSNTIEKLISHLKLTNVSSTCPEQASHITKYKQAAISKNNQPTLSNPQEQEPDLTQKTTSQLLPQAL